MNIDELPHTQMISCTFWFEIIMYIVSSFLYWYLLDKYYIYDTVVDLHDLCSVFFYCFYQTYLQLVAMMLLSEN